MSAADPVFVAFCEAGLWPGLGRKLAAALGDAGIRQPDDVTSQRLATLPKVGATRASRLLSSWIGAQVAYEVAQLLVPVGLPARLASRIVDSFDEDPAGVLKKDPWCLLEVAGVTITEADRLAISLLSDARRSDPRRGRALVFHFLARAARDGHTALPTPTVLSALQGEGISEASDCVKAACDSGGVIAFDQSSGEQPLLALARYAMAEDAIAEAICRLAKTSAPLVTDEKVSTVDGQLDDTQLSVIRHVVDHGVTILTGGPGTGKSRTISAAVHIAEGAGKRVALAAPTGRAAKRLEELSNASANTIHRMLGAQGKAETSDKSPAGMSWQATFARNESWPLDADVVVIDETSMLDVELAAALLDACADGTHVLFVGDPAQLPSIGPGRVLADLIESSVVPVVELTTLYRQAEGGAIARLATAVRSGELPPVESPDHEVVIVPAQGSADAGHRVVQLVTDSIPRALGIPASDVQVVTPVHDGSAGTIALNKALKAVLNPGNGTVSGFDVGDRVVAVANHFEIEPVGFANGEIGIVSAAAGGEVTVEFSNGPATITGKALGDLKHGWAITIHRAQGSEWPAVVAVLPPEAGRMLSRPLVYTALTRAQRHLSIVHAAGRMVVRAVREVGARPRRTQLKTMLTTLTSDDVSALN